MTVVPIRQSENEPTEDALMRLQRVQQSHDELAHRDILSFNLHKRLKHMTLHFYKYSGNIEAARLSGDKAALRRILVDAYIICMASANAINVSLGRALNVSSNLQNLDAVAQSFASPFRGKDVFAEALSQFVLIGGKMAKALESEDHMEDGNPRAVMSDLVPKMATLVLGLLALTGGSIETAVLDRLSAVERKSIFARPTK